MSTILIIDDDAGVRDGLRETFVDQHHEVLAAASGMEGLALLEAHKVDAVLLDLRMAGLGGIEVLRRIQALPNPPPVTVLTAHATAENTIEAMRLGAFDHLTKPLGRAELIDVAARMLSRRRHAAATTQAEVGDSLIGSSSMMRQVQKTIGLVADSDTTVLITGETGTGKEVVAQAIHRHGARAGDPFIALNCAAIPTELLESELFGHVKGAFTGAINDRKGAFREAHGGTLFLDEIGDMDLAMQAKMLRALQDRSVTPLGGKWVLVDVRVITATHRDLAVRVRDGSFREDLLYRLNVVPIHLAPLRERLVEIIPLAEHFLRLTGAGSKRLSADGGARLQAHDWPGNVRELKNTMERVAVLIRSDLVTAADLDFLGSTVGMAATGVNWLSGDLPTALARVELAMIERALDDAKGNRAEAARRLNISRQQLYVKLKRHGLEVSDNPTCDVIIADTSDPSAQKKPI
jgi:DNA-binding NtrC family response regulator